MIFSFNAPIWLYPYPTDFRKQLDGLIILVADHLQLNPTSGQLFVFRNRQANKLKMLWCDTNGFWLCYKRLEKGKFKYPPLSDSVLELTRDQLSWLLSGLDFLNHTPMPKVNAVNFF